MSTALIVTGQLRSFEKTIDQLDKCIITTNNAVLLKDYSYSSAVSHSYSSSG